MVSFSAFALDCFAKISASALAFRNWLGGERVINTYCHNLAMQGGQLLAKILGTTVLGCDGDQAVNMVSILGSGPWRAPT